MDRAGLERRRIWWIEELLWLRKLPATSVCNDRVEVGVWKLRQIAEELRGGECGVANYSNYSS